jgi:hypothetical protein
LYALWKQYDLHLLPIFEELLVHLSACYRYGDSLLFPAFLPKVPLPSNDFAEGKKKTLSLQNVPENVWRPVKAEAESKPLFGRLVYLPLPPGFLPSLIARLSKFLSFSVTKMWATGAEGKVHPKY